MGMLQQHAELVTGQKCTLSEPFSAGQYSVCFELVAEDDSLIIARVRLPRHPTASSNVAEEDEQYQIQCELATMRFVAQGLPQLKVPSIYAYEGPGSQRALDVGAPYMLIQGFYGNSLNDLVYGETAEGEPVIGRISSAAMDNIFPQGPFQNAAHYFTAAGMGTLRRASEYDDTQEQPDLYNLGATIFLDIVRYTPLFESHGPYPLCHMDLHMGNILVDDDLNFMAIIDWEFAQTVPWQVNSYPGPFPLWSSDESIEKTLNDPDHVAHKNVKRHDAARKLYSRKFDEAAAKYADGPYPDGSYTELLGGAASRIYAAFMELGSDPEQDQHHIDEMLRLAFGLNDGTNWYIQNLDNRWNEDNSFLLAYIK
ncbi:hypothetical protein EDB82DRAFT_556788 [Fusarium venenatum]|uniref:uncharacterized protein n=1 Tax=Fusarium venenatum TaxID=56646 RepID=UPI001D7298DE|nr:hypothetical protein EDB82DRAFT_556788 [Fusarium venenatum]